MRSRASFGRGTHAKRGGIKPLAISPNKHLFPSNRCLLAMITRYHCSCLGYLGGGPHTRRSSARDYEGVGKHVSDEKKRELGVLIGWHGLGQNKPPHLTVTLSPHLHSTSSSLASHSRVSPRHPHSDPVTTPNYLVLHTHTRHTTHFVFVCVRVSDLIYAHFFPDPTGAARSKLCLDAHLATAQPHHASPHPAH